jgi:hypothetical protein|tara:strand:- start:203 stop:1507 length:1305 start_codon:yes stop_codon:yes gene_type:complete
MTKQNRTILKTYFQQGDIPTQGQYTNLIDSNLNLHDGEIQIISGSVSASGFISNSAITASGNISSSGEVIASSINATNITGSNISASLKLITSKIITGSIKQGITLVGDITSSGNISSSRTITGLTGSFGRVESTTLNGSLKSIQPLLSASIISASIIDCEGSVFAQSLFLRGGNQAELQFSDNNDKIYWDGDDVILSVDDSDIILAQLGGVKIEGSLTASSNISASGIITGEGLYISDDAEIIDRLTVGGTTTLNGNTVVGNASTDTHKFTGHITASGNISASGHISSSGLIVQESGSFGGSLIAGNLISSSNNIYAEQYFINDFVFASGSNIGDGILTIGDVSNNETRLKFDDDKTSIEAVAADPGFMRFKVDGNITASGGSGGNISGSGTVTANKLKIDGSQVDFTGLPTSDPSVAGRLWNDSNTLKISAG